jgi:hypothetical protein
MPSTRVFWGYRIPVVVQRALSESAILTENVVRVVRSERSSVHVAGLSEQWLVVIASPLIHPLYKYEIVLGLNNWPSSSSEVHDWLDVELALAGSASSDMQ